MARYIRLRDALNGINDIQLSARNNVALVNDRQKIDAWLTKLPYITGALIDYADGERKAHGNLQAAKIVGLYNDDFYRGFCACLRGFGEARTAAELEAAAKEPVVDLPEPVQRRGVFIAGMDVPRTCGECPFFNGGDCFVCCHPPCKRDTRANWCPLSEIAFTIKGVHNGEL